MSSSLQVLAIEDVYTDIRALITAGTIAGSIGGNTIVVGDVFKRKVVSLKVGTTGPTRFPAIVVGGPMDQGESIDPYTNQSETMALPVNVGMFARFDQDPADALEIDADYDTYMLWRQLLILRYQGKMPLSQLAGVAHECRVEPAQSIDQERFLAGVLAGLFTIRVLVHKTRT